MQGNVGIKVVSDNNMRANEPAKSAGRLGQFNKKRKTIVV